MFKDCFSSHPVHAPYSGVTVIFGYFAMKASIAFSVASCLVSPPHQENFNSTGSVEAAAVVVSPPAAAVVSAAGAAVVLSVDVLLLPHAASDNVITDARVKDNAFLILFLIDTSPFLVFCFLCVCFRICFAKVCKHFVKIMHIYYV